MYWARRIAAQRFRVAQIRACAKQRCARNSVILDCSAPNIPAAIPPPMREATTRRLSTRLFISPALFSLAHLRCRKRHLELLVVIIDVGGVPPAHLSGHGSFCGDARSGRAWRVRGQLSNPLTAFRRRRGNRREALRRKCGVSFRKKYIHALRANNRKI